MDTQTSANVGKHRSWRGDGSHMTRVRGFVVRGVSYEAAFFRLY